MYIDLKSCRWLCALCCAVFSVCTQAQTLGEVVQQALVSYPAVVTARAKMEAAQADIARARSGHYPQISMGLSANSYASGAIPASVGRTTLSPTAKVNLWAGGRIQAETERSQALTAASEAQRLVTQEDVALQATEAYLNWSKASELHHLSVRNLQAHQETLDDIRKIAAADVGRRIDLEQAQVRVDNARLNMDQRESDLMQAVQRVRRFWTGVLAKQPADVTAVVASGGGVGPFACVPGRGHQPCQRRVARSSAVPRAGVGSRSRRQANQGLAHALSRSCGFSAIQRQHPAL